MSGIAKIEDIPLGEHIIAIAFSPATDEGAVLAIELRVNE